jgi:colanic acid/amylovoran biosynthesis glycosyltransferase
VKDGVNQLKEVGLEQLVVAQLAESWLPQTQAWLYHQVTSLPKDIISQVICRQVQCLDQYQIPNIHCFSKIPAFRRKLIYGFLSRLGMSRFFEARTMVKTKAKVAHSHFGNVGWINLPAVHVAHCRHVVTFYGYDLQSLPTEDPRWVQRYLEMFQAVDLVLAEGPYMRQSIVNMGCPGEKARVHHLGVDLSKLNFNPRHWSRNEPLRVLIAGSFVEKKGIPYAIEALGRISSEVNLSITVIGDARNEKKAQNEKCLILETIKRCKLTDCVKLMGYQPYSVLLKEAEQAHVFLSPSVVASNGDCEGGAPVTIIEMAAMGVPIVSTRHCDIPNVVQDGISGFLAEERSVEDLVVQLRRLIQHPEMWDQMLLAGRRRIEEHFDSVKQGEKLAAIYMELAAKSMHIRPV